MEPIEIVEVRLGVDTPVVNYTAQPIDEYLVIVNDSSDWKEIHNYIINENEIDGIPNRKIDCVNIKEYSLRSSVYEMSVEEAEVLRKHPKVESVELNPDKYISYESAFTNRYKREVIFSKPLLPTARIPSAGVNDILTPSHTNGIRSNWNITFTDNSTKGSQPYQGVGIASTTSNTTDVQYSLTGRNVDAIIIDSGIGAVHPEFIGFGGVRRVKDVILDGPYKVDPDYFTDNNLTYTKIIDGVNFGVGIASTAAREWWTNSAKRSAAFQSLGTVGSIDSGYTIGHALSKTVNVDNNEIAGDASGHGTACASQIGGKSFGHAFECNIWNIRIALGGTGGLISASTALDVCTIFHNAKKISQPGDPDPTLINNSYGSSSSTGNTNGVGYAHTYRGSSLTYTGTGSATSIPANAGACRNNTTSSYRNGGSVYLLYSSTNGQYLAVSSSSNSSAENAISAGCIVVASAGNSNQKLSDSTDVDYNNYYGPASAYICRVQGIQKGFSGTDTVGSGSIRVGALDCAVEPASEKQGSTAYSIRKVSYSSNGPMIDIWAPGEMTLAAGYSGTFEDYAREDDSNFFDTWFNGTSAAGPNCCSLIALYLETNRRATQQDVRTWINRHGSKSVSISDPYGVNDTGYWSQNYNSTFDQPSFDGESYNVRGNGNLRGAPNRVIHNPFANNTIPAIIGANITGFLFDQGTSSQTVAGSSSVAPVEGGDSGGGGGGGGGGALSISITSSSFSNGASIGGAYYITGGNCHPQAANTSPQVSWTVSGDTSGADSIRCLCLDVDASNFIHWMVFSIPLESGSISENGSWPSGSSVQTNDWDGVLTSRANGWGGPCPDSQHTYNINFYVVDSGGSVLATSNTLSFEAG